MCHSFIFHSKIKNWSNFKNKIKNTFESDSKFIFVQKKLKKNLTKVDVSRIIYLKLLLVSIYLIEDDESANNRRTMPVRHDNAQFINVWISKDLEYLYATMAWFMCQSLGYVS